MPATVVLAGMAPHSGRASIASTVSNVWGCSPGPGMLWTRRPSGIVTRRGSTGGDDPGWGAVPGGSAVAVGGGSRREGERGLGRHARVGAGSR